MLGQKIIFTKTGKNSKTKNQNEHQAIKKQRFKLPYNVTEYDDPILVTTINLAKVIKTSERGFEECLVMSRLRV